MGYVYYNSYQQPQRKTLTKAAVEERLQEAGSSDKLDLNFTNLAGLDLHMVDLSAANLSRSILSDANLEKANLEKAVLQWANLSYANLRDANLNHADLCGADLRGADLRDAHLSDADLSGADLSGADLRRADLGKFRDVRKGANLERADLRGADLREARLWGTRLNGANLSRARLNRFYLLLAFLNRARLRLANTTSSPGTGIRRVVFYLILLLVLASAGSAGYFLGKSIFGALFAMLLAASLVEHVWNVAESLVHRFSGIAKVLKRASMLMRRRIVQAESALASPLLFWAGIALFGLGWRLVPAANTWNALYGLISIIVGFGMVLPGWVHTLRHSHVSFLEYISHALMPLLYLSVALAVGITPHASFLEYLFYLLVLLVLIVVTSALGITASLLGIGLPLGTWIAMGSPLGIVAFLLWKLTDFLDQLDEALKGPLGWFVLGCYFVLEGMDIGGIWSDVGIALAIVCALVGLAWKLVRIAVLEGSLANPPAFAPPPDQWNLGRLRRRTRYPWLAFFAALTGGFLLLMWLTDTGIVKQSADSFLGQAFPVAFLVSIYLCIAALDAAAGWGWGVVILGLNIVGYFFHFPVLGTLLFALVGNER